ncbi:hypothetical protein BJY01DRAFT_224194 [Aspergillus pseudoustus]|uniref:Metallo-beta-lactamase domain-containing protein n=1 Tax=Aspergillus pseudoustus TaxID=1810923 RepID=A0ABR4J3N9_9EURO
MAGYDIIMRLTHAWLIILELGHPSIYYHLFSSLTRFANLFYRLSIFLRFLAMARHNLVELDSLVVQSVVDNQIDALTSSPRANKRGGFRTAKGLSLIITATKGPLNHTVLYDTGPDPRAWVHNYTQLQPELPRVEHIVISQWHPHTPGTLAQAIKTINQDNKSNPTPEIPVDVPTMQPTNGHPEHHILGPHVHTAVDPSQLESFGAQLLENNEPHTILDDMFLVSESLPAGSQKQKLHANGRWLLHHTHSNSQSPNNGMNERFLICKLKGESTNFSCSCPHQRRWIQDRLTPTIPLLTSIDKGLIVITACGHVGLKPMCSYALNLLHSPADGAKAPPPPHVHALVGGLHMEEAEQVDLVAAITDVIQEIDPDIILGGSCTGLRFQLEVEERLPGRFVRCFCGGEYIF